MIPRRPPSRRQRARDRSRAAVARRLGRYEVRDGSRMLVRFRTLSEAIGSALAWMCRLNRPTHVFDYEMRDDVHYVPLRESVRREKVNWQKEGF